MSTYWKLTWVRGLEEMSYRIFNDGALAAKRAREMVNAAAREGMEVTEVKPGARWLVIDLSGKPRLLELHELGFDY